MNGSESIGMLMMAVSMLVLVIYCISRIVESKKWMKIQAIVKRVPRELYVSDFMELLSYIEGDRLVYEYEYNGKQYVSTTSTILPHFFRPFVGNEVIRAEVEEAFRYESMVWVFVDSKRPYRSAITLDIDIVAMSVYICLIPVCVLMYVYQI